MNEMEKQHLVSEKMPIEISFGEDCQEYQMFQRDKGRLGLGKVVKTEAKLQSG